MQWKIRMNTHLARPWNVESIHLVPTLKEEQWASFVTGHYTGQRSMCKTRRGIIAVYPYTSDITSMVEIYRDPVSVTRRRGCCLRSILFLRTALTVRFYRKQLGGLTKVSSGRWTTSSTAERSPSERRHGMIRVSTMATVHAGADARAETRLESFLQVLCSVAIPL